MTRVAVIGCGYFAGFHHDAWSRLEAEPAGITMVGVCDQNAEKAAAGAARYRDASSFRDAATMLSEATPDLVDIVTPPATHAPLIALCAEHGVHAICQKPLAPTLAEAETLAATAERAGITVIVHENFRFQPWFREARRLIEDGRVGAPYSVSFRMRPGDGRGPEAYLARQPYFQQMDRFLIHETGIHFVDSFRMLLGEVTAVTARLRRLNPVITGEDAGAVLFEFESGASALFDANRLSEHVADNPRLTMGEMWLEGEGGVLRLDGDGGLHLKPHGAAEVPHHYAWRNIGFGGDCVMATTRAALEAVRTGHGAVNTARDYLRNMAIVEAIYRSDASGERVSV